MKCSEFQELAASYALDALSEQERLACADHLQHEGPHDGCEALLARYETAVRALAEAGATAPVPEHVWNAIELRTVGRGAAKSAAAKRQPVASRRELAAWAIALAALLGLTWTYQSKRDEIAERTHTVESLTTTRTELGARLESSERALGECTRDLAELGARDALAPLSLSLLEDPATKIRSMSAASTRPLRATALYNEAQQRAVVVSSSLAPIEGKDYELWVIAEGKAPAPAGFVRFTTSGVAIGEFDPALLRRAPAALAVSLEPVGGRPTPTEVVLLAKLEG